MALGDQTKYKIISRLLNEEKATVIAEDLDVPYSTVIRLNRELKEAQASGDVAAIMDVDAGVLATLADEIRAETPDGVLDDTVATIKATKTALDVLQVDLQVAAKIIVDRAKHMSMSVESVGEIESLAETLCKLQNAFFNKNLTQVNVQNNYGTESKYGSMLSDAPKQANNNRTPVQ